MDESKISLKISRWIDIHKEEILSDLKKAVEIPGISDPDSGTAPYGQPCREVLDCMLKAARGYGFETENYHYHVGGVFLTALPVAALRRTLRRTFALVPAALRLPPGA